ncbi:alpha-L-fucosidase [Arcticibacter eurypsychrophilus]|uniref:alpha-L-fucosidase n=1 Tax=Arcticibacter eurypsychrophilus TaxID=1434752 RepID=UPI0009F28275|nr:alpha-L-fucosidase [Arcticibacter eurypsychrophilus]
MLLINPDRNLLSGIKKYLESQRRLLIVSLYLICLFSADSFAQAPVPFGPVPSAAQLQWHETGMYCIVHFGPDTFTDKEWGYGDEDPALFNPKNFDAMQIVGAAKSGGFKGIVLVAKHHDGFCLWPTKTTEHNISKSPWKNGKGDLVEEFKKACDKLGMKFGLYCSPWDRNSALYGKPAYVEMYRAQIKELYTKYGPLFMSWHDGANGGDGYYGAAREKRTIDRTTYYGWDTTFALVRKLQPNAAIFGDIGPDVRWVGNEEGHAGITSWQTYTPAALEEGKIAANGFSKYWEATTGHRDGQSWMPAECDVSLRPGWFYHAKDDNKVKSPYELFDLYFQSMGRGAGLDLGLSPDRRGVLHENDVKALKSFGELLKQTFDKNLLLGARFDASNIRQNNEPLYGTANLIDADPYSSWITDDEYKVPVLTINLKEETTFNIIKIRENIKLGQRIDSLTLYAWNLNKWEKIAGATSIGSLRLIRLSKYLTAKRLRLVINDASASPAISELGLYAEPVRLGAPEIKRNKSGEIEITSISPVTGIHYVVNGGETLIYQSPFLLPDGGIIKANAMNGNKSGEQQIKEFGLAKNKWKVLSPVGVNNLLIIDDQSQTVAEAGSVNGASPEWVIDLASIVTFRSFTFLPPQDNMLDGIVDQYVFYVSDDNKNWKLVSKGTFANIAANRVEQRVALPSAVSGRYIKFLALHVLSGTKARIAEIGIVK